MNEKNPYIRLGKIIIIHKAVRGRIPHPFLDRDMMTIIDRMLEQGKSIEDVMEEFPFKKPSVDIPEVEE